MASWEYENNSSKLSLAGWGEGSNSQYLYQVNLEWIEQAVCEQELNPGFIPEDMICAGPASSGRDTCHVSLVSLSLSLSLSLSVSLSFSGRYLF